MAGHSELHSSGYTIPLAQMRASPTLAPTPGPQGKAQTEEGIVADGGLADDHHINMKHHNMWRGVGWGGRKQVCVGGSSEPTEGEGLGVWERGSDVRTH